MSITQDPWVLRAIKRYRVPFSQQPYQPYPPRALTHPQAEEALMQQEIGSMLEKHAIEETTPRGCGFPSTIFLVPKKDGGQRPVINLKSLHSLRCNCGRGFRARPVPEEGTLQFACQFAPLCSSTEQLYSLYPTQPLPPSS